MIDTIKLAIPLTRKQHALIHDRATSVDREQWVLFNPSSGELRMVRVNGLFKCDQNSYHRELRFDISPIFITGETYLCVELSLPKLWYGHNIWLLYGFSKALTLLKERLEESFGLTRKNKLPDFLTWLVCRLDICYAWKFPSQSGAKAYLDSLKHLHFPRKQPTYYTNGIQFAGTTYSVKLYLKHPEFREHDLPELKKRGYSLDYINYLESEAQGVLRYEATLRNKYLRRMMQVNTVSDLYKSSYFYVFDGDWPEESAEIISLLTFLFNLNILQYEDFLKDDLSFLMTGVRNAHFKINLTDEEIERILSNPELDKYVDFVHKKLNVNFKDRSSHKHYIEKMLRQEIFIKLRKANNLVVKLQFFLTKFIGDNSTMQEVDRVEQKLSALYKPNKVARLVGFWLYVQRFGTNKAKELYGRESYYTARSDLKKAGVSLVEPKDNVIKLDEDFFRNFKLEVPSHNVINRVDNERNSQNLLNLLDYKQQKESK